MTAELLHLGIAETGRMLRSREISVPELVSASLSRIAETSATGAFFDVYTERSLTLAQAHQTLLDMRVDLGPLHGLPLALKANIDIAGQVVDAGSRILEDRVADEDATVASALQRGGAVVVGATAMHEFAWGGTTQNPHRGSCRNPWDLDRIPAGSSGGSGAAAATRSVLGTIGTDTGGSVRLPASMNGVTGLRPTIGRVSNTGVLPLAWSMDTVGPIAPSAEDCALMFATIVGFDHRDPTSRDVPIGDPLAQLARPIDGLRIALVDGYSLSGLQPGVDAAVRAALGTLAELGCRIETITVPELAHVVDAQIVIDACEPSALHLPWLETRAAEYGDDVRTRLQAGTAFSAVDYIQAQRFRTHLRSIVAQHLDEVDAILCPTIPFTAPRLDQRTVPVDGSEEDTLVGNMKFTAIASMTGMPAISVPCGFDGDGMPVGMQLIAAPFAEELLLRMAHAFQSATGFHSALPPLISVL